MALVISYRLTMEVAAPLTLFVDVHRRPRKAYLPNLNIVGQGTTTLNNAGQTPAAPVQESWDLDHSIMEDEIRIIWFSRRR